MTDQVQDFIHAWMRRIDVKLDQILDDNNEFRTRLGRLEKSVADVHVQLAEHSERLDRMHGRLERIERRLDLNEADAVT